MDGDYGEAINFYQLAAENQPRIKKQYFYNNIGTAYVKNSQFEEAFLAFTEYEKLFPDQGRPFRNWAMYHALKNDIPEAILNLRKAVKLGFNDLKWFQNDSSMEVLRNHPEFQEIVKALEREE